MDIVLVTWNRHDFMDCQISGLTFIGAVLGGIDYTGFMPNSKKVYLPHGQNNVG
jgi:hypothetical protein